MLDVACQNCFKSMCEKKVNISYSTGMSQYVCRLMQHREGEITARHIAHVIETYWKCICHWCAAVTWRPIRRERSASWQSRLIETYRNSPIRPAAQLQISAARGAFKSCKRQWCRQSNLFRAIIYCGAAACRGPTRLVNKVSVCGTRPEVSKANQLGSHWFRRPHQTLAVCVIPNRAGQVDTREPTMDVRWGSRPRPEWYSLAWCSKMCRFNMICQTFWFCQILLHDCVIVGFLWSAM